MLIEIKVEDYRGKNILTVANNIKGRKDTSANSKGEFYEKRITTKEFKEGRLHHYPMRKKYRCNRKWHYTHPCALLQSKGLCSLPFC